MYAEAFQCQTPKTDDSCTLRCHTMSTGKKLPKFRSNLHDSEGGATLLLGHVVKTAARTSNVALSKIAHKHHWKTVSNSANEADYTNLWKAANQ
jgi:hypothetical protein